MKPSGKKPSGKKTINMNISNQTKSDEEIFNNNNKFVKKKMNEEKLYKRRYAAVTLMVILAAAIITAASLHEGSRKENDSAQQTAGEAVDASAIEQLSADDRKIATLYAGMYGFSEEEVAGMKLEGGDWDSVYTKLEEAYFSISETEKYQMAEEGYLLEDLYEAEIMARKTGKRAMDLALAKGKADEKKSWTDVLGEDAKEEKSIEEKLGLMAGQVRKLKKKKYTKDERIDIALLCLNRKESFGDIMKELESGKSIGELKEESEHEK